MITSTQHTRPHIYLNSIKSTTRHARSHPSPRKIWNSWRVKVSKACQGFDSVSGFRKRVKVSKACQSFQRFTRSPNTHPLTKPSLMGWMDWVDGEDTDKSIDTTLRRPCDGCGWYTTTTTITTQNKSTEHISRSRFGFLQSVTLTMNEFLTCHGSVRFAFGFHGSVSSICHTFTFTIYDVYDIDDACADGRST